MRVRASCAQLTGTSTLESALERDKQNLGIEAPALDGLQLEDSLRGRCG